MPAYLDPFPYSVPEAQDRLIGAVLRSIRADHYADEADPNADAESEYAAEQVEFAARDLVNAVNRLAPHDQPTGWPRTPGPKPTTQPEPRDELPRPSESSKSA